MAESLGECPPAPSTPLTGRRRLARVGALGGATMLLATGAHLLGGGRLPSAGVLLLAAFLVGLTAVTVTARRCRTGALTLVLGIEQFLLHVVFHATSMPAMACTPGASTTHTAAMTGCLVDPDAVMAVSGAGAGSGLGMVFAHVAATLATALLLARGERWLWELCERVIRATGFAPTLRVRRTRPLRPLPAPALLAVRRCCVADPRGPPAPVWYV